MMIARAAFETLRRASKHIWRETVFRIYDFDAVFTELGAALCPKAALKRQSQNLLFAEMSKANVCLLYRIRSQRSEACLCVYSPLMTRTKGHKYDEVAIFPVRSDEAENKKFFRAITLVSTLPFSSCVNKFSRRQKKKRI